MVVVRTALVLLNYDKQSVFLRKGICTDIIPKHEVEDDMPAIASLVAYARDRLFMNLDPSKFRYVGVVEQFDEDVSSDHFINLVFSYHLEAGMGAVINDPKFKFPQEFVLVSLDSAKRRSSITRRMIDAAMNDNPGGYYPPEVEGE